MALDFVFFNTAKKVRHKAITIASKYTGRIQPWAVYHKGLKLPNVWVDVSDSHSLFRRKPPGPISLVLSFQLRPAVTSVASQHSSQGQPRVPTSISEPAPFHSPSVEVLTELEQTWPWSLWSGPGACDKYIHD